MRALLSLTLLNLRLNGRNRMALIYGYVFPLIFLLAFWALYRHDQPPLAGRMGALLTVTALGGACFGLPTTLVDERERGVWRRYRLTPAPAWTFLAAAVIARYGLLLSAALLQLALAIAIGCPLPTNPVGLLLAFTATSFAFMGLGLVIAAVADNVPAVQALGQCVFLPMLMIGGVAVSLYSLPEWAVHLSAFFPGRYAVETLQSGFRDVGLSGHPFALAALLVIGAAAALSGLLMFRWSPSERLSIRRNRAWLALALGAWVLVGLAAERRGVVLEPEAPVTQPQDYIAPAAPSRPAPPVAAASGGPAPPPSATPAAPSKTPPLPAAPSLSQPSPPAVAPAAPAAPSGPAPAAAAEPGWRQVGAADYAKIAFDRLPPDTGILAPIATGQDLAPDEATSARLDGVRNGLPTWAPAMVADPVQRARNLLYVAAVPDELQMDPLERHLPGVVFQQLRQEFSETELKQILYWIAMHPQEGDDSAIAKLNQLGLPEVRGPTKTSRERAMLYAFKFLGRLTGDIG